MQAGTARAPQPIAKAHTRVDLDVWPAAGGGILLSSILSSFGAPATRPMPNLFFSITPRGDSCLMGPYAELSTEDRDWIIDIMCDELELPERGMRFAPTAGQLFRREPVAAAVLVSEWQLRGIAAVARCLLIGDASEVWGVSPSRCAYSRGSIACAGKVQAIASFAAGASLHPVPSRVETRCGRAIHITAGLHGAGRNDSPARL
jgi:hypothetical protein